MQACQPAVISLNSPLGNKLKILNKTKIVATCCVIVAVAAMLLFKFLDVFNTQPPEDYNFLWEKIFVVFIALFSFIFSLIEPKSSWRWPLLMAYVHYFSGFIIMEHWGQIPPFELIYITILALPGIILSFITSFLVNKIKPSKV